ncbi:ROK family protein [Chryseotalea sanaruensis]|uniref:ROK family protein n=1 Tax=Chryseotalea sanaruensis TaxID=2482724 RepID=A0A401U9P5_9BACT|nr:ROK family protein [Chryseotalea sanaruensis]GCC51633.1 ROK family protein [Chryseotalea sanaruensis]
MKNATHVLGVDIGGSHLTAALIDMESNELLQPSYVRIRVNSKGSAYEILNTWCEAIESIFEKFPQASLKVGFAMPGPFDYERGISKITGLDKYEALYDLPVKEFLAGRLKIEMDNIRMMNDAACFLKGEVAAGAGIGYQHVIGLTLGTGTGTATYHNGITKDANLGPSPFMDSIADNYFSTRWFVNQYYQRSGKQVKDVKELLTLHSSDMHVSQLFADFTSNMTLFLKDFIQKENPELIIMGGNISQAASLFLPQVMANLSQHGIAVTIVCAALGEEAALLGAANLFQ